MASVELVEVMELVELEEPLSPALGCTPRPEGRGAVRWLKVKVSAGNLRSCRLTQEYPRTPNGPLSLQGEG
ncbi:hypothetical protein Pssp01_38070 [Pseudomonas sp. NBRC 100443]|nr:hypothetical protein Pssp01_38070 [Pseudomonas sp. NBRC 100443]